MWKTYQKLFAWAVPFFITMGKIDQANSEQVISSSAFSNQQSSNDRVLRLYGKLPAIVGVNNDENEFVFSGESVSSESEDLSDLDETPQFIFRPEQERREFEIAKLLDMDGNQRYVYNPFYSYSQYGWYTPRPRTPTFVRQPSDVLLIVVNQESKCSNESKPKDPKEPPVAEGSPSPPERVLPPSRCVWAIVACCSPTSFFFRFGCFSYMGCTGAFWQTSPCQVPIIMTATKEALRYYQQFETPPSPPTKKPDNAEDTTTAKSDEPTTMAPPATEAATTVAPTEAPPAER